MKRLKSHRLLTLTGLAILLDWTVPATVAAEDVTATAFVSITLPAIERAQLDQQLGYELSKLAAFQFQAQNLLPKDSATAEFSQVGVTMNGYALSERRFSFGIWVKF